MITNKNLSKEFGKTLDMMENCEFKQLIKLMRIYVYNPLKSSNNGFPLPKRASLKNYYYPEYGVDYIIKKKKKRKLLGFSVNKVLIITLNYYYKMKKFDPFDLCECIFLSYVIPHYGYSDSENKSILLGEKILNYEVKIVESF